MPAFGLAFTVTSFVFEPFASVTVIVKFIVPAVMVTLTPGEPMIEAPPPTVQS